MMRVISDSGPIIALAKINRLDLLKSLFVSVAIPPMVYKELMGKFGKEWDCIEKALKDFIQVVDSPILNKHIKLILKDIDEGERQAIALAQSFGSESLVLLDDKLGRQAARKLNISLTGVVGVLVIAKEKGLATDIGSLLKEIRKNGYWLSDEILEMAKKMAGEA